ncbi:DNA-binding transcriptional LysR family regulator [Maritalea mobilis]|uniref:DNA-binding transcriptional LysR family regulator n=1 Tax=Maritalea mobilis TaxID=483324 RepID=A0A4R6VUI1_9HYPH|nr:LysR family transcriptional regulator [Maritalea mobilis]TDQ66260.1 DNA-binding transcriptional LysR family regulator [Maritalea mobilis]
MDLIWLRDFEALTVQKSFSRAAEVRNVSQPAFSRRIRALEDEVGVKLIDRQTLPLSLTPAGQVFLSQAKIILDTFSETVERCQTIDAANENQIRFATTQSLYLTHYKSHIAPLVDQVGLDVDLNSSAWEASKFVTALQQNYCDIILTYWHPDMDFLAPLEVAQCDYITLSTDRLLPVTGAENGAPLFSFDTGQNSSVPLLSYGNTSSLRPVVDGILSREIHPKSIFVVSKNALAVSIKAMILKGFGFGWLPFDLCKEELENGNILQMGDERLTENLQIRLYKKKDNDKPTLQRLWREVESHA